MLGSHEHRGRGIPPRVSFEDFRNWTDLSQLIHIDTRGSQYTWSNGRVGSHYTERKLDRSICNEDWLNFWSIVTCTTLTRSKSDHFPIMLIFKKENRINSSSFKFMKMWSRHPNCLKLIT